MRALAELLEGPDVTLTYLVEGEPDGAVQRWTRAELRERATRAAGAIAAAAEPGDRALLVFAPGLDYLAALLGCALARVTPVPAYPPDPTRLARTLPRLAAIAEDAEPRCVLTTGTLVALAGPAKELPALAGPSWVATDSGESGFEAPGSADPDELALLQYTSGSTSAPRGVELTHRQVLSNVACFCERYRLGPGDHMALWLPMFHDMGLVGGLLSALHAGFDLTFMAPHHFLQRPRRWPAMLHATRATVTGGPNFAWDLTIRKTTPEERAGWDLSSLRVAVNAAEPVRPETVEAFGGAFAVSGFRAEALVQNYGLAETTVFVCGALPGERRVVGRHVSAGPAVEPVRLAVVGEDGTEAAEGEEGEVWVQSPSVGRGYFRQPEASERTFRAVLPGRPGTWLRTGDLGVLREGELYLTGRLKDVLIVHGRSVHPQDLERPAEQAHAQVRPGCVGAVQSERGVFLLVEVRSADVDEELAQWIARAAASETGVVPDEVVLLRAGSLPKTSSGKLQRSRARALLEAGELDVVLRTRSAGRPEDLERALLDEVGRVTELLEGGLSLEATPERLNLDSVALVDLAAALEARTGVTLTPEELFDAGSLGEVAELLRARGAVVTAREVADEEPATTGGSWLERQFGGAREEER